MNLQTCFQKNLEELFQDIINKTKIPNPTIKLVEIWNF
jgi:hypothetical protein